MDNPVRAITFVAEIRAVCGKLVDYPHAFASVPGRPDTHRYLHGKYLIYYRIRLGRVTVARIVHGARNQPSF